MNDNKWVNQIINLQKSDGSWGHFHSFSQNINKYSITTEQALRRLSVLGLTYKDEPIRKAVEYMKAVLVGEIVPPDRREKVLNWNYFEQMMMAAWIKLFYP